LACVVGGGAGIVVGQPLDVLKVRLQHTHKGIGIIELLVRTVKNEGVLALFKGMLPPLGGQVAFTSLSFAGYNKSLAWLGGLYRDDDKKTINNGNVFLAGCVGGALSTIATTPCELLKVNLQTDTGKGGAGSMRRLIRQRLAAKGLRGLYSGWGVTLLRDCPATGLYFLVYYATKNKFLEHSYGNRTMAELFAGGLAGVVSWGSIVPLDVVKTRLQTDACLPVGLREYSGIGDCFQKTFQEEGIRGLTRGTFPLLLRAFPVNAVTFFAYEHALRMMEGNHASQPCVNS